MPDILLLGATGFTGRLVARYLAAHPQRGRFTWAVVARSRTKLEALAKELKLSREVALVILDVTNEEDVQRIIKTARVVINTVGPFHRYGTPVVRACVRNAVHYVDTTGETPWIRDIIMRLDYFATKTGAIIVPSCGMDSIPSDLFAYLSNKTLKSALNEDGQDYDTTSTTAYRINSSISGGTFATAISTIEEIDENKWIYFRRSHSLSPATGLSIPLFQPFYRLTIPGEEPLIGGYFMMRGVNTAIVQRTQGLFEVQSLREKMGQASKNENAAITVQKQRYGSLFRYDEFFVTSSVWKALVMSFSFALAMLLLRFLPPVRWLAKMYLPQPGEGPSDEQMKNGYLIGTNLTTSASHPPVQVKTVIKIKGDPGYQGSAIMVSECALALLLPLVSSDSTETTATYSAISTFPPLAQKGGVLTPVTAFGDLLVQRLQDTGVFEFSSSVLGEKQKAT
ncbi:hypothetical protein AX14_011616 [Amanita brunnescens Koide BX004]|nr:hypothetical protein AX14_011616 [Amanita brunnescens Koide BX004]